MAQQQGLSATDFANMMNMFLNPIPGAANSGQLGDATHVGQNPNTEQEGRRGGMQ